MTSKLVLMPSRQTRPSSPSSSAPLPPGLVNERKRVTNSCLLFWLTASPRGWKWRPCSLHRLARSLMSPMMFWVSALITVIVSWPLLATNTRLPFGEITMFHGSAPVVRVFSTRRRERARTWDW